MSHHIRKSSLYSNDRRSCILYSLKTGFFFSYISTSVCCDKNDFLNSFLFIRIVFKRKCHLCLVFHTFHKHLCRNLFHCICTDHFLYMYYRWLYVFHFHLRHDFLTFVNVRTCIVSQRLRIHIRICLNIFFISKQHKFYIVQRIKSFLIRNYQ